VRFCCLALLLVAAVLTGCAGDEDQPTSTAPPPESPPPAPAAERGDDRPALEPVRCPPAEANCRSASGEIVFVEAVDPDGDGDAHFVLLSEQSVTAPGFSVIDVARDLRPHPLPRVGDRLSAAGPVFRGSYGQRQIQATEIRTAPG